METAKINEIDVSRIPDEEIVAEVKKGNGRYFGEIVKRYNQRMYRIALSYGIQDDDAEDVLQTAYIAAYEKIEQFRGEAKFSTWLTRILINECLMLKRRQKKIFKLSEEESVTIPAGNHLNPENDYMNKENKQILETAIKQLPEKYRSVYIFKEVEGLSVEETSDLLKISKVNVKVRLFRAKAMLKEFISGMADVSALFTFGNARCDRVTNGVMDYIINKSKNDPETV